jgi:hypothetical protein
LTSSGREWPVQVVPASEAARLDRMVLALVGGLIVIVAAMVGTVLMP